MANKKGKYPQKKNANREYYTVKEVNSLEEEKTSRKLDKNLDSLLQETIEVIKNNQDFLKKLTDEANEQMSRSIFIVKSK